MDRVGKLQKGRTNVIVQKSAVEDLLTHSDWYTLLIPADEIVCMNSADVRRFEAIALTLLQKYLDRFYYVKQNNWESQTVGYELTELTDDNFPSEYTVTTTDSEFVIWLQQVEKELNSARQPEYCQQIKKKHRLLLSTLPSICITR